MARRTRRRRYTWFPNLGTAGDVDEKQDTSGASAFLIGVDQQPKHAVFPLTFDTPAETGTTFADENLGSVIANEYVIRRIVGNWFINLAQEASEGSTLLGESTAVLVTAGIFVARAQDAIIDSDLPLASGSNDEVWANYSPASPEVIREPFLWRRSWLLGCGPYPRTNQFGALLTQEWSLGEQAFSTTHNAYPSSNVYYGDVMTGPHIDSRVMRRVSNDDRLWGIVAAQNFPIGTQTTHTRTVVSYFDYRILGALRKAKNRGNF